MAKLELPAVDGRAVSLEVSAIPARHGGYLRSVLAERLGRAGARIVSRKSAELRLTALVGSIGTASSSSTLGIPSVPIPPAGTPEIPLVSIQRERGWTQVRLLTWDLSGRLLASSPTVIERARFDITTLLFLEFRRSDVYDAPPSEDAAE